MMTDVTVQAARWSCLRIKGPDTRQFLQGQLSNDVTSVSPEHAVLAGLCTPKGRLLANFYMVQLGSADSDDFVLLLPESTASIVLTTLSKYIVFSKADISMLPEWTVACVNIEESTAPSFTAPANESLSCSLFASGIFMRIRQDLPRCLIACTPAELNAASPNVTLLNANDWVLHDIRDGLGFVEQPTSDQFIPQMLNMHLTDGISFTKGCYTGQEIVARAKYKGAVKRQMRRLGLASDGLPPAGSALVNEAGDKILGTVISAARATDQQVELLAVLNDPKKPAFLNGVAAQILPLPYQT